MFVTLRKQIKRQQKKDGVENQMTITIRGMYDATTSEKVKIYFDKAAGFGNENDFNNAKKFYLMAIKEDAKYVKAYDNLGLVYRRL